MEQHIAGLIAEYSKKKAVKDYLEFQKNPSVWSALFPERESYEKFYSRMIRYFLSPAENHGLGEAFADILVDRFSGSACNLNAEHKKVERFTGAETEALGSNIDILYRSVQRNRLIVIEAKMNSADHSHVEKGKNGEDKIVSQLDKYYNAVVSKSGGYQDNYFIYLTINGDAPTQEVESVDSWVCMSYKELHEDLGKLQKIADERLADQQNLSAVLNLISDFRQDTSRKIRQHTEAMDKAASNVLRKSGVKEKFQEWGVKQKEVITQDQSAGQGFKRSVVELCVEQHGLDAEIAETCFDLLAEYASRRKLVKNDTTAEFVERIAKRISCECKNCKTSTEKFEPKSLRNVKYEFADINCKAEKKSTTVQRTAGRGIGLNIRSPYTKYCKDIPGLNEKEKNRKDPDGNPERAYFYIAGTGPTEQFPSKASTRELIDELKSEGIDEINWNVRYWSDTEKENFEVLIKCIKHALQKFYKSNRA